MVALVLRNFGGMLPRYGDETIPATAATIAKNCRLLSGELQALKRPTLLTTFTGWSETITRAFRVQDPNGDFYAVFDNAAVNFVRAPITQDSFNRHYWTTETAYPRYATGTMLDAHYSANEVPVGYRLGIPAPGAAPSVTPGATGGPLEETRVYVYTFVSAYGEESAPSPPTIVTGDADSSWSITGLEGLDAIDADLVTEGMTAGSVATEYNITQVYVYRTITGTLGAVDYFRVAELSITALSGGTGSHTDSMSNDTASLQPILQSSSWTEPPKYLKGLTVHPNGFLLGFLGRDIYMSVPYRPHAWPVEYIISTKWDIVGFGVTGQSIVILTEGSPYVASGVRPEAMTLVESDTPDKCMSRYGIVSSNMGVMYPGPDGLMLVGPNGAVSNLTKKIVSRREWRTQYYPYALTAAKSDSQYIAFYSASDGQGFSIDFEEANQAFVLLDSDEWIHSSFQNDPTTGEIWLLRDNALYLWNPERGSPVEYTWRSKEFDAPNPTNFGAVQITYSDVTNMGLYDPEILAERQAYNDERILQPLNPMNFSVLNGVEQVTLTSTLEQDSQQFHNGPLYLTSFSDTTADLIFNIYVNRETDPVYSQEITDMDLYRPPTGFKSVLWSFELIGTADVQSVKIATTSKELAGV